MRPTIHDVAKRLNLSITTVSRALDGYKDVAKETRNLVVKTALEMGYVPNRAARQLRRQRTDTIGYILPSDKPQFADAFFSEFIAGLGDEAAAQNYDLLVSAASPDSPAEQALYRRWVQGGKVGGMVVNRVTLHDWRLKFLDTQDIPHVSLERSLSRIDFVGIIVDSHGGFIDLISHLVDQGHNRIAYIGGAPELKIDYDRYSGYQAGLQQAKVKPIPSFIERADLTPEGGFQAASRLLSLIRPPTAIVCANDLTAIGALHAAHERGLEVGHDIAIAGFDGIADSAHTQPPLTTLEQPVYAIARKLVTMLLALINNETLEKRQIKIHPKLLLRASTGSYPHSS
jgi:LacI family transcriptional regulator